MIRASDLKKKVSLITNSIVERDNDKKVRNLTTALNDFKSTWESPDCMLYRENLGKIIPIVENILKENGFTPSLYKNFLELITYGNLVSQVYAGGGAFRDISEFETNIYSFFSCLNLMVSQEEEIEEFSRILKEKKEKD